MTPTIATWAIIAAQAQDEELGGDVVLPVIAVGCAAALAAYAYAKRKRRAATRTTPGGGRQSPPPPAPLDELDAEASRLLVETDDAVRTSTEELGFAVAQFGDEAVKPFTHALEYARTELAVAFRVRQQLDESVPTGEATQRRILKEIVARCAQAGARLDAESADFDRLRALEQNAPDALDHAERVFREVEGRTGTAEATFAALAARYADSAVAPVAGRVEEAKERLLFTLARLGEARQALDAGDSGTATVRLRAVEGAVDQAGTLVDSVDRLAQELAAATGRLPGALTETEADLGDARGMLEGPVAGTSTSDLRGRIARAETVVGEVRETLATGRHDPIDALRRIEEADAALEEALAGTREKADADRRALALLDQAILTSRSGVGAAADYVTTHRGAVGGRARTRLAEALRHLDRAAALAASDTSGALAEAQQAGALARQAQQLAAGDVDSYESRSSGDGDGASAVLGGILLGGEGGGAPGSFGGRETRARRGGDGRS
ncbi:TPM domain-containing protein [Streptomyces sp. E11-3]|uniref:TPM domain-containing protein n=1 Tax=Streptomyces sp. E11-3 TaxID=3110112 RepID=UPI0039805635